jgi:hypothetical protein
MDPVASAGFGRAVLRRCASTQSEDPQTALRTVAQQAQPSAQAIEASVMMRLMARVQRPHRMLQPRQA